MKLKLPDTIHSAQDLTSVIQEIHGYASWIRHDSIKQQAGGAASTKPLLTAAAEDLIADWIGNKPVTAEGLQNLADELRGYAMQASSVTITLAAPPNNALRSSLVIWCRQNIAADVLVSFQFNSSLLGGMVVRFGSRIFDWSFRQQILESRSKFPEVLRRV